MKSSSEPNTRPARHHYDDPLARVWINCAERLGFRVSRTDAAYVTYDGRGTIAIGHAELLDADDSLAQIILHELCHALVEGDEGRRAADWGLDNTSTRDVWREHACLRLQAYLAGSVGLREFFAPTTDFRLTFWPELPADPLSAPAASGGRREPSCVAARLGAWRASRYPWVGALDKALTASAAIARATIAALQDDRGRVDGASLWSTVGAAPARHPAGHSVVSESLEARGCVDCAWAFTRRNRLRCRHAPERAIPADSPACVRWEAAAELACEDCGACCREAFDAVEVAAREAINREHPELVIREGGRRRLRRDGDRCAALQGGLSPAERFRCAVYPHRPRACRDFPRGSENCLQARKKVGLSL